MSNLISLACYLLLERRQTLKKSGIESKTPRYRLTHQAGYFKPLEAIKNAKDEIIMYYQRNDKCNPNSKAETRLQCKGSVSSINFSSIYFVDMEIGKVLIGYGEPPVDEMLLPAKKKDKDGNITVIERPNPFYENRNDGYLFIVTPDMETEPDSLLKAPKTIEILIVPNGRYLIQGVAKQLIDGQLNEALKQVRTTAKPV